MASLDILCLCAAWCGTCREFQPAFEALEVPGCRIHWVDVEDHADLLDPVDIQTFPTILVVDASRRVLFAGPLEPQIAKLDRLVRALMEPGARVIDDLQWAEIVEGLAAEGVLPANPH